MSDASTRPGWLTVRFFAFSFLFWGVYGGVGFLVSVLQYGGGVLPLPDALRQFALGTLPYAFVTPIYFEFADRLVRRGLPGGALMVRLLGGLAIALAVHVLVCVVVQRMNGDGTEWLVYVMLGAAMALQHAAVLGAGIAVNQFRVNERRRHEAQRAQLQALRSQLQPHFLFNTLQAIGSTARSDGPLAARLTALLGDMLRQILEDRAEPEISLADELELLEPYLELQRLRFGDRLTIDVDVPDDLLCARVPDLLLQPLVENALQHGIEARPGAGRIVIGARRVGRDLALSVRDDGAGDGPLGDDGIGLGTTRSRLQGLYGGRAQLTVERAVGGGALATVQLPFGTIADAA